MSENRQCPACGALRFEGTAHVCGLPPVQRLQTVNPHSVELTLTSAGKIGASVKVYDDDPATAYERAAEILDRARLRYQPESLTKGEQDRLGKRYPQG